MSNPIKMSKADLLDTLRCGFDLLKIDGCKGAYKPDPARLAAMARRIELKTTEDPTRLAGETLEDLI